MQRLRWITQSFMTLIKHMKPPMIFSGPDMEIIWYLDVACIVVCTYRNNLLSSCDGYGLDN